MTLVIERHWLSFLCSTLNYSLFAVLHCWLRIRDSGNVVTFIAIVYVFSLICFFIHMVDQFPCYVSAFLSLPFRGLFSIIDHYVSLLQFLRVGSSINPLLCSSVVDLTQLSTYCRNTLCVVSTSDKTNHCDVCLTSNKNLHWTLGEEVWAKNYILGDNFLLENWSFVR